MKTSKSIFLLLGFVIMFGMGFAACGNGTTDGNENQGSSTWPDNLTDTKWERVSGGTAFKPGDAYITFYYDPAEGKDRMYIKGVIISENATSSGRNNLQSAAANGVIQLFMGRVCDSYTITQNGADFELTFSGGGKVGIAARFDGSKWRKIPFVHPDDK